MRRLRAHDRRSRRAHRSAFANTSESIESHRLGRSGKVSYTSSGGSAMRTAKLQRNTTETKIALALNIDGRGKYEVSTGIRFFDHMLELFTRHGAVDLRLKCNGDLDV